jgi:hypothetical protein
MRLPTAREAEFLLRRSLRILTPIAVVFLAMLLAFEFIDWLPDLLFGHVGRRDRFIAADRTTPLPLAISLVGLVVCGVVAMSGDEVARRRQPITWYAVINGAVLVIAGCVSLMTSRLG